MFGGALGLATASAVWSNYVNQHLRELLSDDQVLLVLKSTNMISLLPEQTRLKVVETLISSYNQRTKVLIGFTAAQFIALAMLWRRPQISLPGKEKPAVAPSQEDNSEVNKERKSIAEK